MHGSLGPLLALLMIGAIVLAALHDFALVGAQMLAPWFGWMFP